MQRPATCSAAMAALICLLVALLASSLARPSAGRQTSDPSGSPHHLYRHHQQYHSHTHIRHRRHHHQKQQLHDGPSSRGLFPRDGAPADALSTSSWPSTFDMIASGGAGSGSGVSEFSPAPAPASRAKRSRREAELRLAVNRLRILESLDGQLRAFSKSLASRHQQRRRRRRRRRRHRQELDKQASSVGRCELSVEFGAESNRSSHFADVEFEQAGGGAGDEFQATNDVEDDADEEGEEEEQVESPSCLSSDHLRRHIPAYMLNLHRKLLAEASSWREAVRLMPYRSTRVRSFRQAPVARASLEASLRSALKPSEQQQQQQGEFMKRVIARMLAVDVGLPISDAIVEDAIFWGRGKIPSALRLAIEFLLARLWGRERNN